MTNLSNMHHFFASLPFGLLLVTAILEFYPNIKSTKRSEIIQILHGLFLCTVIFAYFSGSLEARNAISECPTLEKIIETHRLMGKSLLILSISSMIFASLSRLKLQRSHFQYLLWTRRSFIFIMLVITVITIQYGSNLVFEHGAGVSTANCSTLKTLSKN